MRRWVIMILVVMGIMSFWASEPLSLVVMDIENRVSEASVDGRTLSEIVEMYIVNMRRFRVVERQKLDRVIVEQKLNQSGLTEREVARVGLLVGASKVVVGSLTRIGRNYMFILRLIDTSTATIDEVAEARESSLERLYDRIEETVKKLLRRYEVKVTSAKESKGTLSDKKSNDFSLDTREKEKDEDESDEEALNRLVQRAKEKLQEKRTSKEGENLQNSLSSEKTDAESSTEGAVQSEISTLWKSVANNPWGIILQLGIGGNAQIYPANWNFIGFGWGLFTLENRLYIGYEFALIEPKAYIMAGYQTGLLPYAEKYLLGLQVGLVNRVGVSALGWQVGLVNQVSETMMGVQQGFVNTVGKVQGVQIGFINTAKEVQGLQMGFLNTTRRLYGVQLGFLNVSLENGLPFMVGINIGF